MRRTNGGSRYNVPSRVIPERGKVSENSGKSSSPQSPDVLHDDELRSKLANQAAVLSPQSASFSVETRTSASHRYVLAGKAAADGVDGCDSIGSKPGSVKVSHVVIDGYVRPVLGQHAPAEVLDLAEGDGLKACAFQAEAERADAAEQVEQHHAVAASFARRWLNRICAARMRLTTSLDGSTGFTFSQLTRANSPVMSLKMACAMRRAASPSRRLSA